MLNSSCEQRRAQGFKSVCLRACALALCALLASAGVAGLFAGDAWADVRRADSIMGSTVEERGIAAALCPSVDANYVYVADADGTVYFERDASAQTHIASITKVMTAVVALENAPLDTEVTVSEAAAEVGESSVGLAAGDVMSLDTALYALMVPSGNDAAIAIAETVGSLMIDNAREGGTPILKADGSEVDLDAEGAAVEAFVAAMNAKAAEIGCTDTLYANPHGLDINGFNVDMHSTASDVAKVSAYAMKNEDFRKTVANESVTIEVERGGVTTPIELESTDELIGAYEGACGIKTGFTEQAGPCFAGAAQRDGQELYAVVLDSTSESQRFTDAETLFDWVWDNLVDYQLANSDETASMTVDGQTSEVPVVARVAHEDWPDRTVNVTFADPAASVEVFALNGNVSQDFQFNKVTGNVHVGDVVGQAVFYQHNEEVARVDLVACEDVAAPNIFESFGIWWDRLVRGFSGQQTVADTTVLNDTPLIYDKQATIIS